MAYADLLRDPRWQRKRLEVMAAADFACQFCHATDKTLNVHHIQYVQGRKPWEYDHSELECLCEECHKDEHGIGERARQMERRTRLAAKEEARRERLRLEHPDLWALENEDAEIRARMPLATSEEKDALMYRRLAIRDLMLEHPAYVRRWRSL